MPYTTANPHRSTLKAETSIYTKLEIGYNTGQFHHGTRKNEQLITNCIQTGLLSDTHRLSKTGDTAYKPFAKFCIVFALRNRAHQVTGLYFRSTVNDSDAKHYYLKERSGIYPCYPKPDTIKLILTVIIDAATLLQLPVISEQYSLLACYGTNGLNEEIRTAIQELKQLQEIVFAFDNDEAGNKAAEKYGQELKQLLPHVKLSKLNLPDKEDINSTALAHHEGIFTHLLETRTSLFFSTEATASAGNSLVVENKKQENGTPVTTSKENKKSVEIKKSVVTSPFPISHTEQVKPSELNSKNPYKLVYQTGIATYYIQGGVSKLMDSLKIT